MRDQVKGLVLLNLVIGADGRPGDIRVVRSPHPDLTRQAITCVREWLFKPATQDGAPVAIMATVEVTFHIAPKK
jgi:TonB family protein